MSPTRFHYATLLFLSPKPPIPVYIERPYVLKIHIKQITCHFQLQNQRLFEFPQILIRNIITNFVITGSAMNHTAVKSLGDTPYCISMEEQDVIGQGPYSKVICAFDKTDNSQLLVAKVFQLDDLQKYGAAIQELNAVKELPLCANLVKYHKIKVTSKNHIYIIMEYCDGGTLASYILSKEYQQKNKEQEVWQFVEQFVNGYKQLFDRAIVHGNIRPENILLHQGDYKIADYGLARIVEDLSKNASIRSHSAFKAPQIYTSSGRSKVNNSNKLDVYSFGAVLYYMMFGKYPYLKKANYQDLPELRRDLQKCTLYIPGASEKLTTLLCGCLEKDPQERIGWPEIFQKFRNSSQQKPIMDISFCNNPKQSNILPDFNIKKSRLELVSPQLAQSMSSESLGLAVEADKRILHLRQQICFIDRLVSRLQKFEESEGGEELLAACRQLNFGSAVQLQQVLETMVALLTSKQKKLFLESLEYRQFNKQIEKDFEKCRDMVQEKVAQQDREKNMMEARKKIHRCIGAWMHFLVEGGAVRLAYELLQIYLFVMDDEESVLLACRKHKEYLQRWYSFLQSSSKEVLIKDIRGWYPNI